MGAVAGTDHGAAAPMVLIGPPALNGGLHGDHPDMGSTILPADNLAMTTDLRRVYQSVLQQWLGDPDPNYVGIVRALARVVQQLGISSMRAMGALSPWRGPSLRMRV